MRRGTLIALVAAGYIASISIADRVKSCFHGVYDGATKSVAASYESARWSVYGIFHDNPVEAGEDFLKALTAYQEGLSAYNPGLGEILSKAESFRSDDDRQKSIADYLSSHPEYGQKILEDAIKHAGENLPPILADIYDGMGETEKANSLKYGISTLQNKDAFLLEAVKELSPDSKRSLVVVVNKQFFSDVGELGKQSIKEFAETFKEILGEMKE